jgi:lipopolysaccharide transport system permease protein
LSKKEEVSVSEPESAPVPQLPSSQFLLPDEPLVVIERSKTWVSVNLSELWTYRELLYFLAWRDVKVRYKQTVLGVIWIIIQPALMTIIFTVFLGELAGVPSLGQIPYAVFAYSGLSLWTFFSGSILAGGQSLVANANLITKVYFPRLIIPCSMIAGRLIDLLVSFLLLAILLLYYGIAVTWSIFFIPIFIVLLAVLALGVNMLTSAFNVKYRDVGIAVPVLIQLWMFVSPIVYPLSLVPPRWQRLYALNPMVGIVEGFRASLFNREPNWWAINVAIAITIILLVYSAYTFRRIEKSFADLI